MYNKIVRVAVNNNFNCTALEFKQLDTLSSENPDCYFFVNSNIKTPNLLKINDHPYKAVITLNPDILINEKQVEKLYRITCDNVSFVRIKYIPNHPEIVDLINSVRKSFNVVITLQRFNGKKTISQYVPDFRDHYKWSHNRFRLSGDSLKEAERLVEKNVFICDQKGLGCGGCGLCSTLTTGMKLSIYTLNLSTSGICPYSCVDCYAKTMQHFLKKLNKTMIHFNWIHMNKKQSGDTKHIKSCEKNVPLSLTR